MGGTTYAENASASLNGRTRLGLRLRVGEAIPDSGCVGEVEGDWKSGKAKKKARMTKIEES